MWQAIIGNIPVFFLLYVQICYMKMMGQLRHENLFWTLYSCIREDLDKEVFFKYWETQPIVYPMKYAAGRIFWTIRPKSNWREMVKDAQHTWDCGRDAWGCGRDTSSSKEPADSKTS